MSTFNTEWNKEYSRRTAESNDIIDRWLDQNAAYFVDNIKSVLYIGNKQTRVSVITDKMKSLAEETNVHQTTIDDFLSTENKYDLVIFSFVLSEIQDRQYAISKAMAMLKDSDGLLLIFHDTTSGIRQLQTMYGVVQDYGLSELEDDLKSMNVTYTKAIQDATINIDNPTKQLCNFILKKECSEEESKSLLNCLGGFGALLYQSIATITISQNVIIYNQNGIEGQKLVNNNGNLEVNSQHESASLYGMSEKELCECGIYLYRQKRTFLDPLAITIADHITRVIQKKFQGKNDVIVIDPFLGPGNLLYQIAKRTNAIHAYGIDRDEQICEQTMENFKLINFSNVTCHHGDFTSVVDVVKPSDGIDNNLYLIILSSLDIGDDNCSHLVFDKRSPSLKSLVELYSNQFKDKCVMFVIPISDKTSQQSWKELQRSGLFEVLDANLACSLITPKCGDPLNRRLSFHDYQASYVDFVERSDCYAMMEQWCKGHFDNHKLTYIKKLLCVGAGPGIFETMLAKMLINLESFHCVEPNICFIPKFWQSTQDLNIKDKKLYFQSFEDFHCSDIQYDLILFSHSLYYIQNPSLQLVKATQSLLTDNGSILIFHESTWGLQVEIQKTYHVEYKENYNSSHVEQDLIKTQLAYEMIPLHTTLNVKHRTMELYNFLLERYTTNDERVKLDKLFDINENIIPNPDTIFIIQQRRCQKYALVRLLENII